MDSKDFPGRRSENPRDACSLPAFTWIRKVTGITRKTKSPERISSSCFLPTSRLASGGTFVIDWRGQRCALEVADTPFVITRVDRVRSQEGNGEEILIRLKHLPLPKFLIRLRSGLEQAMSPTAPFETGNIAPGFPDRPITSWRPGFECDPHTGAFFLELNDTRYPIAMAEHCPSQMTLANENCAAILRTVTSGHTSLVNSA